MSVEALERLTDRIYDAVFEPDAWTDVLADLVTLAGADQAMLLNASVVTGMGDATVFGNESPAAPVGFQAYYAAINPLTRMAEPAAYLANWRPTMIRDEDIVCTPSSRRPNTTTTFSGRSAHITGCISGLIAAATW